jgi:hypothetical protein
MIPLDQDRIEKALPLVAPGLAKYCHLLATFEAADVANDRAFQRAFNGFYRVRRNTTWQSAFYALLAEQKSERQSFSQVLRRLHDATGRVEASFASKLVATVDPHQPVIDAFVLDNLGLKLPLSGTKEDRLKRIDDVHATIRRLFDEYLATPSGQQLIARFEETYPNRGLTPTKVLDLVLWQVR